MQFPTYTYDVQVREYSETGFLRSRYTLCHCVTKNEARHYAAKEIARQHNYRHNFAQALAAIGTRFVSCLPPYVQTEVRVVAVRGKENEMEWNVSQ